MYLFETMKLKKGQISRLTYHEDRIQRSSKMINIPFDQSKWDNLIQTIQYQYNQGIYRLKVMLEENGKLEYVVAPLSSKSQFTATIVPEHNDSSHLTKINKTSNRNHVTYRLDTDLALIYDKNGKILEFDIGNIMIKENGNYYTPQYNEDFLLGCMRQYLIDHGKLKEKNYYIDDFIKKVKGNEIEVFLLNSLREVADVTIYL